MCRETRLPGGPSSLKKSLNISKENITPLTVVCNKKQDKTATASPASTIAGIKRHRFLDKIINLRQQAADKAQQRKKAMSLINISHKLPVRKKTVNSTLCSELSVKAFEASESCRSESQRSIVSSLNSQSIKESSLTSSEMSKDIPSPLPQSLSNKTKISVTQTQPCHYRSSTSDSIRQTSPREFDEFVTTKDKSEIDIEPDEVSLDSSQTILTSKLTTGTTTFNNLDESLVKLNKKVDNMRAKLDLILINQCKMNRFLMSEEKILSQPPNMPALSLDTIEQVKIFEKFLSNDIHLADICYYLKSFPLGNDEIRAVPKLMSNLMSNSLVQEFNFDGHGVKLAFKSTKLWELVQGTLLKFEQSDLSEALKSLRSWLQNAKGRKL